MGRQFVIPAPCKNSWTDLRGDTRQRYCESCQTHVHAIEQYSAEEWDRIWRESNGHACGYLCEPSAPEARSRREVLVGALITAISPLIAQSGRLRIRVTDASGSVVPGAETSLLESGSKPTRTIRTNSLGEAVWTELAMGENRFT